MSIIHNTDEILPATISSDIIIDNFIWPDSFIVNNSILEIGTVSSSWTIGISQLRNINISNASVSNDNQVLLTDGSGNATWQDFITNNKENVVVETIENGNLSTDFENGDTINGIILATGDRILIRSQTNAVENGIYIVQASGAPLRSNDLKTGDNAGGIYVISQKNNTGYTCTNITGNDIVGTDGLNYVPFNSGGIGRQRVSTFEAYQRQILSADSSYIELASGEYEVSNTILAVNGGNKIIQGVSGAIIKSGLTNDTILQIDGDDNITIEDLTFDLANNDATALELSNCSNINIINCKFIGIGLNGNYITTNSATYINIIDCTFEMDNGIGIDGSGDKVLIENCSFNNTLNNASVVPIDGNLQNLMIINCSIDSIADFGVRQTGTSTKRIIDSSFISNSVENLFLDGVDTNNIITSNIINNGNVNISSNSLLKGNILTSGKLELNTINSSYSIISDNKLENADRNQIILNDNMSDGSIITNNGISLINNDASLNIIEISDLFATPLVRVLKNGVNYVLDDIIISNFVDPTNEISGNLDAIIRNTATGIVIVDIGDTTVNSVGRTFGSYINTIAPSPQNTITILSNNTADFNGDSFTIIRLLNGFDTITAIWTGKAWRQLGESRPELFI